MNTSRRDLTKDLTEVEGNKYFTLKLKLNKMDGGMVSCKVEELCNGDVSLDGEGNPEAYFKTEELDSNFHIPLGIDESLTPCCSDSMDSKEYITLGNLDQNFLTLNQERGNIDIVPPNSVSIKTEEMYGEDEDIGKVLVKTEIIDQEDEEVFTKIEEVHIKMEPNDVDSTDSSRNKSSGRSLFNCEFCPYETNRKSAMTKHISSHRKAPYKCRWCPHEAKYKSAIEKHMLFHKDASEVTMYQCDLCTYRTRQKHHLNQHMLTHKKPSEVMMYTCDICNHSTKHSINLRRHMLMHKNDAEVTKFKCFSCPYEAKYKYYLIKHMSIHRKNDNDANMPVYKCDQCKYETKIKHHLKSHVSVHRRASNKKGYKCVNLDFETKVKRNMMRRKVTHKSSDSIQESHSQQ